MYTTFNMQDVWFYKTALESFDMDISIESHTHSRNFCQIKKWKSFKAVSYKVTQHLQDSHKSSKENNSDRLRVTDRPARASCPSRREGSAATCGWLSSWCLPDTYVIFLFFLCEYNILLIFWEFLSLVRVSTNPY